MSVRLDALAREILASARTERIGTALTALLVAGVTLAVIITTGRTVGVEQQVLESIDAAGSRTIVVRAEPGAGVDASVIERLGAIDGIQWAAAFGPAADIRNAALPEGLAVPARTYWSSDPETIAGTERLAVIEDALMITEQARYALGMPDGAGVGRTIVGLDTPVIGIIDLPEYLAFLEPVALQQGSLNGPVAVVVVVVTNASEVEAIRPLVATAAMARDPALLAVSTSEELAQLQLVVAGQLGGHGRSLAAATLVSTSAMVFALMAGLVMIRRKEFGRRRALGASQALIIALVLGRAVAAAVPGAALGAAAGLTVNALGGDPQPTAAFTIAVALLAALAAVLGGVVPAVVASRREPLAELRVP